MDTGPTNAELLVQVAIISPGLVDRDRTRARIYVYTFAENQRIAILLCDTAAGGAFYQRVLRGFDNFSLFSPFVHTVVRIRERVVRLSRGSRYCGAI